MKPKVNKKYLSFFLAAAVVIGAVAVHITLDRERPTAVIIYSDSSPVEEIREEDTEPKETSAKKKTSTKAPKDDSSRKNRSTTKAKTSKKTTTAKPKETTSKKQTTTKAKTSRTTKAKTTKEPKPEPETTKAAEFPIDVNKVTFEELIQISGIGEKTARDILQYRTDKGIIRDMGRLTEINGIGEGTLQTLKRYLYVADCDKESETVTTAPAEPSEAETSVNESTAPPETTVPETEPVTEPPTETEPPPPERQEVDLNKASAEELSEKLLIDIELAKRIVELRDNIGHFENYLELKYIDGMSDEILVEIRDYLKIEY